VYNKLFQKILFSSVWTEDYPTRIVWVMFLAAMDEDGIVQAATPKNVAALAQVTLEEAERAIAKLEQPDAASSNPEHDGRRIERFPGGWIVLNAKTYRDIATRDQARQRTAERVRKHRATTRKPLSALKLDSDDATRDGHDVTLDGHAVTCLKRNGNESVTVSEAYTEAETETKNDRSSGDDRLRSEFDRLWAVYPRKVAKQAGWKAFRALRPSDGLVDLILAAVRPHFATWLRGRRWEDEGVVLAPATTAVTADAERARTVELVSRREALLRGAAQ
jgi:hypothetical protein